MPFIHRFLTPREERNMVYKTFSNAVKKQYPDDHAEIMGQIWKMPYEKLLRASLTTHHVNIYIDLAASRITGVSQYDRYVKHVRRLSRVVGEIEDTPFLDLPRTDDVLMDHLFMKVCEFCPHHQTAEAITNELYEQGYIETRSDIIDMLEQPRLLRKRVRYLYKQIEEGSLSDLEEEPGNVDYQSTYPDTVSLTSSFPESNDLPPDYCLGSTNQNASSSGSFSTIQSSTSAIFTNNFDELFEQAAAAAATNCTSDYGGIMHDSLSATHVRALSPQLDALHLEMVNETVSSSPTSPSRDLMKFSPGPRIRIVVEDGDNSDFDPLSSSQNRKYTKQGKSAADTTTDSDSDEVLSSSETPSSSKTARELEAALSATGPDVDEILSLEAAATPPSTVRPRVYSMPNVLIDEKAQRRLKKNQKQQRKQRPSSFGNPDDDDKNRESCDICDYEKRMSKVSLSVDEHCPELRKYLDETGDILPICVDLPVGCDLSVLLDAGELEPDEVAPSNSDNITSALNFNVGSNVTQKASLQPLNVSNSTSIISYATPNKGETNDTNSIVGGACSLPSSSAISINMPSTSDASNTEGVELINLSDEKQQAALCLEFEDVPVEKSTRRKRVAKKC